MPASMADAQNLSSFSSTSIDGWSNVTLPPNDTTPLTDPLEDIVFGSLMVLYSVFSIIPYSLCLFIFATDSEVKSRPCYRIIFAIGVADILQSVSNGIVGGVLSVLRCDDSHEISKRVGSVLESCWMAYSMLVSVLAFNRFVHICWTNKVDAIFTKKNTSIMLAACWIYGGVFFVVYNTPWVTISYSPSFYIWGYESDWGSTTCGFVEMGLDLFLLFCTVVWYSCILVTLRTKVR